MKGTLAPVLSAKDPEGLRLALFSSMCHASYKATSPLKAPHTSFSPTEFDIHTATSKGWGSYYVLKCVILNCLFLLALAI